MKQVAIALLVLVLAGLSSAKAEELTVASFNVRYHNEGDSIDGNGWQQRCPVICDLIRFNDFQVFGAQEVLHDQLLDLLQNLPGYGYVGVGRDDGKTKGEYAPIFYQKEKFKVLQSGHFWLSEITDRPNRGWDAALPRICTWARLEDRKTGAHFFFFNLHMDHVGVEARKNSARLVLQKIKEMCGDEPIILTGDFNVDQNSPNYAVLVNSGVLLDSYEAAAVRYALNGTFNDFDTDRKTESRIDHVFVSSGFTVERYGVLTDTYRGLSKEEKGDKTKNFGNDASTQKYVARTPSDHFPVKVVLQFNE